MPSLISGSDYDQLILAVVCSCWYWAKRMVTVDTEYHGLGGPELPAIYQALAKLWQAAHPMHYVAEFKTYFAFNRMIAA
jgi:hypothetical protein